MRLLEEFNSPEAETQSRISLNMTEDHNNEIIKELVAAYEARLGFVKTVVNDTRRTLEEFRAKREKMSEGLRELLAKSESLRKKDFDKMMAEILAVQSQREENVKAMLANFKIEEERVAENLQQLMARGEKVSIKDLKRTLAKMKEEQQKREQTTTLYVGEQMSRMQQEVTGMLEEFKKEKEKMAAEWTRIAAATGQTVMMNGRQSMPALP